MTLFDWASNRPIDDRVRQLREAREIAHAGPICERLSYGNKGRACGGILIPLDSPDADFNHRAGGDSNAVCTGCGGGATLSPDALNECRRAESAWNLQLELERQGVRL